MWEIYHRLIEGIPENIPVIGYTSGDVWTMVQTPDNAGVAMTVNISSREPILTSDPRTIDLKSLARCAKSWNFKEASLGVAAINAYYNKEPQIYDRSIRAGGEKEEDAFILYGDEMKGKKVAVVGHFPFLEKQLRGNCELTILEREPQAGDYPDPACEYLLAEQDFILVTGSTLVNKTLPRLLQLKKAESRLIMVGPSVTLSPVLYEYGVDALSGMVIKDVEKAEKIVLKGVCGGIFQAGKMVNLLRNQNGNNKLLKADK